ncbi:VHS-domain-containing protein [Rickenella mellea]|uniref:VHS-domain-containing protein n=1 Tax=Rickenella mellea TaxID=50990 RepID=A0A4Y7PWW9_9AGAM|nr:VHS-domain-containing protein [Rickenella mellea]
MALPPNMFGRDFMSNVSPLQYLIQKAVETYRHEPDYAAHLEVAEYINQKKANSPREAAMTIVRLVNNRNPHVSILSLALLETLVQSCGYPFHLQIATKEFLNELVRRFPERPPPFPGPVMTKILDLIHSWKETICMESRWREDLGNIRDMHRLLTFKGYRFRDNSRRQAAPAAASTSNLKSAEELEEEDRQAQSAKLQELIRRGTPRDLAAAQELMKSLAGAEPDKKPDYRSQSLVELNKLEQKVILMNEMLDNVDPQRGERFVSGDVYDQVSSILVSARPKIQKWISDAETNDPEMLDTFLQINDQINSVLNRYESFKRGDFVAAANPVPSEYAKPNDLSLIDLDDTATTATNSNAPADDLAGLFGPPSAPSALSHPQAPTGISAVNVMASPAPSTPQQRPFNGHSQNSWGDIHGSTDATGGATTPQSSPFGSIMLPGTPDPHRPPLQQGMLGNNSMGSGVAQPNYMGMSGFAPTGPAPQMMGSMGHTAGAAQPMGAFGGLGQLTPAKATPTTTPAQTSQTSQPSQGKDPFADLAGLF